MASQEWMPMRASTTGYPSFFHLERSIRSLACCSRAVRQAEISGFSKASGAQNMPMTASPTYLSRVHRFLMRMSVIWERYSPMSEKSLSVPMVSEMVVNPAISEKNTATWRFSPQRLSFSGLAAIASTTSGSTYRENAFSMKCRSRSTTKYRYAYATGNAANTQATEKEKRLTATPSEAMAYHPPNNDAARNAKT